MSNLWWDQSGHAVSCSSLSAKFHSSAQEDLTPSCWPSQDDVNRMSKMYEPTKITYMSIWQLIRTKKQEQHLTHQKEAAEQSRIEFHCCLQSSRRPARALHLSPLSLYATIKTLRFDAEKKSRSLALWLIWQRRAVKITKRGVTNMRNNNPECWFDVKILLCFRKCLTAQNNINETILNNITCREKQRNIYYLSTLKSHASSGRSLSPKTRLLQRFEALLRLERV